MSELSDEQIETELSRLCGAPERLARALLERARKAEAERDEAIRTKDAAIHQLDRALATKDRRAEAERDALAAKLRAVEDWADGWWDDTTPEATR